VSRLRLAMSQLDTVVGDLRGNVERVVADMARAEDAGADIVVFPELTLTGYPPEDLLLKPAFVAENLAALDRVAQCSGECVAVVGFVDEVGEPDRLDRGPTGEDWAKGARRLRNALALCVRGRVVGLYHKRLLPNYGVFDEARWFAPGTNPLSLYRVAGVMVGVTVCEDLWSPVGPVAELARAGAALVVNANASPYCIGRLAERHRVATARVHEAGCAIAYVNQVGGQDELVFDGGSFVVDAHGSVACAAGQFQELLVLADLELPVHDEAVPVPAGTVEVTTATRAGAPVLAPAVPELEEDEEVYRALVLGTRDYVRKNGFTDALIGLSGGIDSSLVAVVAVDALGADHVHGVSMPSRYSSEGSRSDAQELADALGIDLRTIEIEPVHASFHSLLARPTGELTGLADENLQSRIRGVLLMALSNAQGWIVLTTGNKSELATGYSTLYGDSAGGFAVIKDVPKTLVYRLCRYRNAAAGKPLVPEAVLTKAPSAELRPGQTDEDSLPPYDVLDPILQGFVERDLSIAQLVEEGHPADVVSRVARLVDLAEYKRRQSPPGVRITPKAFGKDRRMPITNRYRDAFPVSAHRPGGPAGDP
jgi:NAD+ synthase (glutamine-hydrolysing)